ncbi:MAG TPA: UDP-N-acetylmuramoyl-tripeptide--D-alanyl-D-alanine ligase [Vicinamibacterales bacterium]|nr:UDP-N-acetylmuramoyl-tripeptide--D-alanyl-D-alanine ligase [Vicinamibacterales bacterium]
MSGPEADREVSGFSIDTRTIQAGDLFIAIRGERFDGNTYVGEAIRKGAAGALVSDAGLVGQPALASTPLITVTDTVSALQRLANRVRRESGTAVVAVTGSAGKSTTKEITADFLSARYRVFRNRGNLNNHIGLPLSLLELRTKPDIGVFELGMSHFGEISALVKIAEPEVRVWTNVGPAHLEFFGTVDAIADAKAEILEGADKDALLVANADDDLVMRRASRFAGRIRTFGVERPADVRALAVRDLGIDGTAALVRTPIGEAEIRTSLPGTANLSNVLAAAAVAIRFDVPLDDIVRRAAALKPVARRGEITRIGTMTLVDDSYNSNPIALSRALAMVAGDTRHPRRIAILGEMLELGEAGPSLHRTSGEEAARAGLSELVAVGGENARELAAGALSAGMAAGSVHYVEDSSQAADIAVAVVKPGDLVLVKGSRGIRTEVVVDRLRAGSA